MIQFGSSIGLKIIKSNVEDKIETEDNSFDAIWCSNLMEHLRSPHLFLRECHRKLRAGGLLFIKVPTIPAFWFKFLYKLAVGRPGYLQVEYLYAFTGKTAGFIIEKSGFRVIETNAFFPSVIWLNKLLNPILSKYGTMATIVAKKDNDFQYYSKRPA